MPGALGRPPGRRRRGCRRPPRTWRTARNRRPATRRPHQADPARSAVDTRCGQHCVLELRVLPSAEGRLGQEPLAQSLQVQRLGPAGPAPLQRVRSEVKEHLARERVVARAGAQVRSAPRRCQRRGRARRAGHDGQSWRLRESAASWRAYRDGRPEPPTVGAAFCSRRPASRPCNTVRPVSSSRWVVTFRAAPRAGTADLALVSGGLAGGSYRARMVILSRRRTSARSVSSWSSSLAGAVQEAGRQRRGPAGSPASQHLLEPERRGRFRWGWAVSCCTRRWCPAGSSCRARCRGPG
jgi:hypothetical protein